MLRRQFIAKTLQAGALLPLMNTGLFAQPLRGGILPRMSGFEDRVFVLINLNGGNDGLNTVVPISDPIYHQSRPNIGLSAAETLPITDGLALHPQLGLAKGLFDQGDCAIVASVGYPDQNRSHFRSTDIWHTASNADEIVTTGWLGRYLESIHPEYPGTLPSSPFAIQIASSATLALQGTSGGMGIAIDNPDRFYQLAKGLSVPPDPVPVTLAGPELEFVRTVIEQSNQYSSNIQGAMVDGTTNAVYSPDSLSSQMKVVARLINGGLATGIYIVTLPGFDTHYGQLTVHSQRMQWLSAAVKSFLDDISVAGNADRVAVMTYSEFGRRLNENGSAGTDHGAAAPLFVFGSQVLGGSVIGGAPSLSDLDIRGDVKYVHDFRQVYASVLRDWMGFSSNDTAQILGGSFDRLPIFPEATVDVPDASDARRNGMLLEQNAPNPASETTRISFRLPSAGQAEMALYTSDGRRVATLVNRTLGAGIQSLSLETSTLPSGTYVYTLRSGRHSLSRTMVVRR